MASSELNKTEELKSNKGNFTFPTHRVNVIKMWSNKKSGNPHFYINPPFQVCHPFLAKNLHTPQLYQFFKVPTPSFNKGGGDGQVPSMKKYLNSPGIILPEQWGESGETSRIFCGYANFLEMNGGISLYGGDAISQRIIVKNELVITNNTLEK